MNKVEVLAPAGNYESLLSAINNGADAVYLGISQFNARGNIDNFTTENIADVVKKAHLFGVKVYLTLNILIQDCEIADVLSLVRKAIDAKVDAFIVQDIGLIHLLSNRFEGIELHASTQMGLQNFEGVEFVKDLGFSRVVLARETALNEIKLIKENCNIDIEYFVQGALCVAFSGNCYLCSLLEGASGNRGKCKQFCRLPYLLKEGDKDVKEGYLLSTKDFCNLPSLKQMVENGVTSLKIEGRARRPAYVGGAVSVYRNAVDNGFNFNHNDILKLKKLFNRGGYISGYFKDEKIIYPNIQNHIGIEIGKVLEVNRGKKFNEVKISSSHQLVKGDALKFLINEKEVASLKIFDVKKLNNNCYLFTTTTSVPVKSKVNLIVDYTLEEEILSKKRKIDLTARIEAKVGQPAKLFMRADKLQVIVEGNEILAESKTQPLTESECQAQISKVGEDFNLTKLDCDIENVFMRKASLNDLRRQCLAKLEEKIIENNQKNIKINEKIFKINEKIAKNIENNKNIYIFNDLNNLIESYNTNDYFVFSPEQINAEELINFSQNHAEKTIYLDLPVVTTRANMEYFKNVFAHCKNIGVYATNYYCFSFVSPKMTIISPEMNVFNSYAIDYYLKKGYDKIVLSKEFFNFDKIITQNAQIFQHSEVKEKYMYFKHCPIKEHFGGDCANCKFRDGLEYKLNKKRISLKRKKTVNCMFYLQDKTKVKYENSEKFGKVIEVFE